MRLLMLSSIFMALSGAFLLYALNSETHQREATVQAKERYVATLHTDVAVLKAERAHLARPDRIEAAASLLGLGPPRPSQFADAVVTNAPAAAPDR